MDKLIDNATALGRLTGRAGLAVLSLALFADAFAMRTANAGLLQAAANFQWNPRTLVTALVVLGLFALVMRVLTAVARTAYYTVHVGLADLAHVARLFWWIGVALDMSFRTGGQAASGIAVSKRSSRLIRLALDGSAAALDLYKERARLAQEETRLTDQCLGAALLGAVDLVTVGSQSLVLQGWGLLGSGFLGLVAKALAVFGLWTLVARGLRLPEAFDLEADVAIGLPPDAAPPSPTALAARAAD